jgi:hypothetical protein
MQSGVTYGGLNDWAMTFQMNNDPERGFWWGHEEQTTAQGAMSLTTAGHLTVGARVDAPIFYDSNDTGYYVNPASTSVINTMDLQGTIRHNGDTNTYMEFHASNQWRVVTGGSERLEVNDTATKGIRIDATSNMRAPIFYDSANTAYYTDPASTSNLNALTVAGGRCIVTGDYFEPRANLGAISANRNPATSSGVFIGWNRSGGNAEANYISGTNGRVDWGRWTGSAYTLFMTLGTTGGLVNLAGTYGTISSDIRLKEDIKPATSKLNDILSLNVVNFSFKSDENKEKHIGFIAQEFQEIFPSLVTVQDNREYDDNGNVIYGYEDSLGLKVGMEFAILTKAIQEQQEIIESLKQEIELLKNN